jgi:hypothetical protein
MRVEPHVFWSRLHSLSIAPANAGFGKYVPAGPSIDSYGAPARQPGRGSLRNLGVPADAVVRDLRGPRGRRRRTYGAGEAVR